MRALAERVARFWRESGAAPRPGAGAVALRDFERRNGAPVPRELAEFYRVTDGVDGDANLFAVWPLDTVRRVPEALAAFRGSPDYGRIAATLPEAEAYFVFADYMIWSHVFAVQAPEAGGGDSPLGPVIWICGSEYGVAAPTLAAFWERYLADPLGAVATG